MRLSILVMMVMMVALVGCKKAKAPSGVTAASARPPASTERRFTIFPTAEKKPEEATAITMQVPSDATVELDPMGAPSVALAGLSGFLPPGLGSLRCPDRKDAAACLDWVISLQFGKEDLPSVEREPRSDGRVWMKHTRDTGHVHARLFVPIAKPPGVLMCYAILKPEDAARLPDVKALCESLRLD